MQRQQILDFLKNNSEHIRIHYHITKIGLIGSYARNEQSDNSDIDLLIEFEPGTNNIYDVKYDLKNYLKQNLNKDVDLCREKYIKPYIKNYILKDVIYV